MNTVNNNARKSIDMTQGNPAPLLLRFMFPILIGNLLQQGYNIIDTAIAGNYLGDSALAAIGATGAVFQIIMNIAQGMNMGFSLLIARSFGSHDSVKLRRSVAWTAVLNTVITLALTVFGILFIHGFMAAMKIPENIYEQAHLYLLIIIAGFPATMLYNMLASVMRSLGNSFIPLVFLIISSILNVILDFLMVAVFGFGVGGAAWATVLAQLASAVLCLIYVLPRYEELRIRRDDLKDEEGLVKEMLLTGLSMSLMSTIVSFGSAMLQRSVNMLGGDYIAGQIGGSRIEVFFVAPVIAVAMALSTYASQNFGAKRGDRIRSGLIAGLMMCFLWSLISWAFLFTYGRKSLQLLTGSENLLVIDSGFLFLRWTLLTLPFLAVLLCVRNSLQSMGHKIIPLFSSATELTGKVVFSLWLVPAFGYGAVCACEPVLWILSDLYLAIVLIVLRKEFR